VGLEHASQRTPKAATWFLDAGKCPQTISRLIPAKEGRKSWSGTWFSRVQGKLSPQ
jgi:hypothetical protein